MDLINFLKSVKPDKILICQTRQTPEDIAESYSVKFLDSHQSLTDRIIEIISIAQNFYQPEAFISTLKSKIY